MKIKAIIVSFLMSGLIACGTTDSQQSEDVRGSQVNRPEWTEDRGRINIGNKFGFVGQSSGKESEVEALETAEVNAFGRIAQHMSSEVHSEIEDIRVLENDKYSYKFKIKNNLSTEPITIKEWNINKKPFVERENGRYNAWVLVEIPKTEYERIQIEVNGFTVWTLKFEAKDSSVLNDGMPAEKIKKCLFPAFSSNGIKLTDEVDFNKSKNVKSILVEHSKNAYFMKIKLNELKSESRQPGSYGGKTLKEQFFVSVSLTIELYDRAGGMIQSWFSGEQTGGEYSLNSALEIGISQAVNEIIGQMGFDGNCE